MPVTSIYILKAERYRLSLGQVKAVVKAKGVSVSSAFALSMTIWVTDILSDGAD